MSLINFVKVEIPIDVSDNDILNAKNCGMLLKQYSEKITALNILIECKSYQKINVVNTTH